MILSRLTFFFFLTKTKDIPTGMLLYSSQKTLIDAYFSLVSLGVDLSSVCMVLHKFQGKSAGVIAGSQGVGSVGVPRVGF